MSRIFHHLKNCLGNSDSKFWLISVSIHAILLAALGSIIVGERYEPAQPKTDFFYIASQENSPKNKDEATPLSPADEIDSTAPSIEPKFPEPSKTASIDGGIFTEKVMPLSPDVAKTNHHVTFFGIQPVGQKIVFVIDMSGSMLNKEGDLTRLEIAEREIRNAINKLGPNQYFNVVLFGDRAASFSKIPIAPTADNKSRAIAFLDKDNNLGGSTNLTAGLTTAIEMCPDAIVVLTDGQANDEDEVILSQISFLKNKLCPYTSIHAIGFFLKPKGRPDRFLARLTNQNKGQYLRWSREAHLASILQHSQPNP